MTAAEALTYGGAFALVVLLAWGAARFLSGRLFTAGASRRLQVLEALSLGKDRSLLLVNACGRTFLLGVAGSQVSLLAQLAEAAPSDLAGVQRPGAR